MDKTKYICHLTGEEIDPSECNDCHTRSCPVNTGFAPGPEEEMKASFSDCYGFPDE